jgi:hypothetical protein
MEMKLPVLIGEIYQVNATSLFISFRLKEQAVSFLNRSLGKVNQHILNGKDIYA